MKVAVLGCGYWGSKHVRVLNSIPDVEHVVAVDFREERLTELRREFPAIGVSRRLEDALEEVDAVIVATPPDTHARCAMTAMHAGKSVLVEKPLATSTLDARQLVDTAENLGVVLGVGHTFEYNAAVWKLRDLLDAEELGGIHYIDSARLNLGLYQSDVNVIWDLAPHDVSICNFILRATPTRGGGVGFSPCAPLSRGCRGHPARIRRARRYRTHPCELARPVQGSANNRCRQRKNGCLQRHVAG